MDNFIYDIKIYETIEKRYFLLHDMTKEIVRKVRIEKETIRKLTLAQVITLETVFERNAIDYKIKRYAVTSDGNYLYNGDGIVLEKGE